MKTLVVGAAVAAAFSISAQAQDKAPPPAWQQGKPASQADSPLHPFAPHMSRRAASRSAFRVRCHSAEQVSA